MTEAHAPRDARSELRTLRPGVDVLPTRCSGCGSRLLDAEEPLNGAHFGALTCTMCGRTLAALDRPLRRPPRRVESARRHVARRPAPSRAADCGPVSGRFRRIPGCGPSCGVLLGHDPVPHVAWGRALERDEMGAARPRPSGTVTTGRLAVDFDAATVAVDGRPVVVSAVEWALIAALAEHAGAICWYADLVQAAWSATTFAAWTGLNGRRDGGVHALRVHLSRLRAKLGPAGALIETLPGRGLKLRIEGASDDD